MVEILCINDKDRPSEIPISKWVKEGEKYNVIRIVNIIPIPGFDHTKKIGFELLEIDLDESNEPYAYFDSKRFAFKPEDIEDLIEIAKYNIGQKEINEINAVELITTS
jgi:hypothetical protein